MSSSEKSREELIKELENLHNKYNLLETKYTNSITKHDTKIKEIEQIAKIGSYELDLTTGMSVWSEELYNLFGVVPNTPITNDIFSTIIHPDDITKFYKFVEESITNKIAYGYLIYRIIHSKKGLIWVKSQGKVILDSQGNAIKVFGTAQDITEVQNNIEYKAKNEILLKEAVNLAKLAYWELDLQTSDIKWYEELYTLLGYTPNEDINLTTVMNEMVHPDDKKKSEEYISRLLQTGKSEDIEFRAFRKNGTIINLYCRTMPIKNTEGNIVKIFGVDQDITERKKSELKLKNLESYLSNIINSMPSILIGVNSAGLITQWNRMAEKTTGFHSAEVLNKPILEVSPGLKKIELSISKAIETEEVQSNTKIPYLINGKTFYDDITIYPLTTDGDKGAVIRIDDVTKKYEMEYQLNHNSKMEAIGQLAGGVAHDFNNMLSGIMSAAQLLKSPQRNLDEKGLKYANMILEATKRTADLTSKLLVFGRKNHISSSNINIHDIINDTYDILKRTIDKKIEMKVKKDAFYPFILADNSAIQHSLINLGINASHAMKNGGTLTIATKNIYLDTVFCNESSFKITPGEYIEIEVSDTGCGIPQKYINKIFEPFFTTKDQGKGTGLGLASLYGTIQDHKGAITVCSIVNEGTTFKLHIPISKENICKNTTEKSTEKGSGKILLVDDEEIIRETGQSILEELGYSVEIATNGAEAVQIFKNHSQEIDMIIMDMIMPIMNGSEAFYKMKEIDAYCKVIISSGYTRDENISQLKENGVKGFLQKPYTLSQLSEIVNKIGEK